MDNMQEHNSSRNGKSGNYLEKRISERVHRVNRLGMHDNIIGHKGVHFSIPIYNIMLSNYSVRLLIFHLSVHYLVEI